MKVTCLQEKLTRGMNLVSRAVATRSPLPVLSNVLLSTEEGGVKLAAMNQQLAISVWIGASIESDGAITVPARLLTDFISQLPEGNVAMELDPDTDMLTVSSGRFRAKMRGIDASEFPPIPEGSTEHELKMPTGLWTEIIDQVVVAAATDDSRPVLAGISLTLDKDFVELAAADGYRLATRRVDAQTGLTDRTQLIVPRSAMIELSHILADDPGEVTLGIAHNASSVLFNTKDVSLVSQIIDGKFPAYEQLIPASENVQTRAVLNTAAFAKATRIASLFARTGQNVIKATVDKSPEGDGRVVLSANSVELGENQGEIEASITGPSAQIAFNYRFLNECLSTLKSERVSLALSGSSSPGLVRQVNPKNDDDEETFNHVIMPMHTVT